MDDMRIVELYRLRDEQAIVETDCKYGAYCRRISENILTAREDADECVNDTYHAVWTHIPPDAPASLRAYLGRIVRNLSLSRFRKNRAAKRYEGMELLLSELPSVPLSELLPVRRKSVLLLQLHRIHCH